MAETSKSTNGALVLCLNVKDLTASCLLYAKLGFKQVGGEEGNGWALINDGRNELHLFQGPVASNTLNFRGGDVFAIAKSLKTQGLVMESDATLEADGEVMDLLSRLWLKRKNLSHSKLSCIWI